MVFKLRCVQRFGIFLLKNLGSFFKCKMIPLKLSRWKRLIFFLMHHFKPSFETNRSTTLLISTSCAVVRNYYLTCKIFDQLFLFKSNIKHFCCFKKSKSLFLFQILRETLRKNCNFVFFKCCFARGGSKSTSQDIKI